MFILSCCPLRYYGQPSGTSYEYLSFVETLRVAGHRVHHFDHLHVDPLGKDGMNDHFLSVVKNGAYDLVLVVMSRDEFYPEVLVEVKRLTPTVAWNCDDDWRWDNYSSLWVEHFTYMVTTYGHIFESNRLSHPNLLLSQWGCTGFQEGLKQKKDLDVSFVGGGYGKRQEQIDLLRKHVSFHAFGRNVLGRGNWKTRVKRNISRVFRIPMKEDIYVLNDQKDVKDVWNRSKISFTPLEASTGGGLQLKARVFDQGLSGSLMLCNKNESIHEFYEPGKEYVEFEDMDDCVEKARYYLKHEDERCKIAEAYYRRTKSEHLWSHRFERLFKEIGFNN